MYSLTVQKSNRRKKVQKRILLITTMNIFNIRPKNLFSDIKIRNKFPITELETIIYAKYSKEFILIFPRFFDMHYITPLRNEVLEYIFMSRFISSELNNNLEFFFVDDKNLHEYCNHKNKKKRKLPKEESMIVNKDEFSVHFLGKENKHTNLLDTENSKKVNLAHFQFIKMLGIGGFSKVYLVKKKGTKEFYAMKSIRLPDKKVKKENEKYKDQVKNERDILVKLKHPFIVKLKYAFQVKRRFFFVMPFIQ